MLSQWNTPIVLPCRVNSTFDVSFNFCCLSGLMHPWEKLVLVLVCLRSRSSIIAPPSVVGQSGLSAQTLFIELLPFHALVVLYCRLCWLCRVVKTMSLTCVKHRRRWVALEEGLPVEVCTEWYWVVVTVWGTLEYMGWTSRHTQVFENEAKVKPQPAEKKGVLAKPDGEVCCQRCVYTVRSVRQSVFRSIQWSAFGSKLNAAWWIVLSTHNCMCIIAIQSTSRFVGSHTATHRLCDGLPAQWLLLYELHIA